jgi:tetratricopeptide (TPR) repeat protein
MKKIVVALLISLTVAPNIFAVVIEYGRGNQQLMGIAMKADQELSKGDEPGALRDVNEALRIDAKFFPAYFIRAKIYLGHGKWAQTVADCDAGLRLEPKFVDLAIMRAIANRGLRRYAASLAELNHVIAIRPPRLSMLSWAFEQRAWLRATCPDAAFRDGQKAIEDAKRACGIMKWGGANAFDALAAAYAEVGDFQSAIKYEQQAITIAGSGGAFGAHLALFQQRKPIRES